MATAGGTAATRVQQPNTTRRAQGNCATIVAARLAGGPIPSGSGKPGADLRNCKSFSIPHHIVRAPEPIRSNTNAMSFRAEADNFIFRCILASFFLYSCSYKLITLKLAGTIQSSGLTIDNRECQGTHETSNSCCRLSIHDLPQSRTSDHSCLARDSGACTEPQKLYRLHR